MTFTDFNLYQIIQGISALLWVLIAIIVGVRILMKAIELKRKSLIGVGFTYIFVCSSWWGSVVQFIYYSIFPNLMPNVIYLFLSNVFVPLTLIFWMYAFVVTITPFKKKIILLLTIIFVIVWEVTLLTLFFTNNITLIGGISELNPLDLAFGPVVRYFIIIGILTFLITGGYFSYRSIKLGEPEIKWKGIFLLMAWLSFTLGALLDALIYLNEITLILIRLLLISSAIEYYLGFFLPKELKNILIK
ncbi:MAG: hypothetical protein EU541_02535 [Promethearchaeota archaeon]|nr:MAG: hypothetical protein EU541_02535 [Candidatus Lokiarchaeota archaeon]